MNVTEVLNRIEELLNKVESDLKSEDELSSKTLAKEFLLLVLQFILGLVKAPFNFIANYIKNEVLAVVKKDSKIMAFISATIIVLMVFFVVFWMSVSVAVGIYFYENGNTLFVSVMYSIAFQVLSSLIVALFTYLFLRKLKTFKVFNSIVKSKI